MEPLATNKRVLVWLFLCSLDVEIKKWKKLACALLGSIIFMSTLSDMLASVAFRLKYIAIDLEECLFALLQCFGFGSVTYAFIVIFFQRHRMREIFRNLSAIYTESKVKLDSGTIFSVD